MPSCLKYHKSPFSLSKCFHIKIKTKNFSLSFQHRNIHTVHVLFSYLEKANFTRAGASVCWSKYVLLSPQKSCSIFITYVSFIQCKIFLYEEKTKKFYVKWRQIPLVVFYYCEWKLVYWLLQTYFQVLPYLLSSCIVFYVCWAFRRDELQLEFQCWEDRKWWSCCTLNFSTRRCSSTHVVVRVWGLKVLNKSILREPISKLAPRLPAHVTFGPGVP